MGKEITDPKKIEEMLLASPYLRLGLCDGGKPYIVPMTFGYKNGVIFLHGSKKGKKIDILARNRNVCFEVDKLFEIRPSDKPCSYDMKYQSVVGFGTAEVLENENEKKEGLKVIIDRFDAGEYDIEDMNIRGLAVIRLEIESLSGREQGND